MRSPIYSAAITASVRPLIQKVFLVTLLVGSLFLLYAERQERDWADSIRLSILNISQPIAKLVASPANAIETLMLDWQHFWQVHGENAQLRADNTELLRWRTAALALEAENNALRQLLNYQPAEQSEFISAHIVGAEGGALTHRMQINAGIADGVARHMPVINEHGLVGRVLHVGASQAELLMLSDISSRIPVTLQPSGEKALLIGAHHELPYLKLANKKANLPLGESVMTSDDGDLLPSGLLVGKLFANQNGKLEVLPAYRDARVDYVRVLKRQ